MLRLCYGRPLVLAMFAVLASVVGSSRATAQSDTVGGRVECPDHDYAITNVNKRENSIVIVTKIAVAGPISRIPEFHDCQRFLDRTDHHYESLMAIWAAFRLDTILAHDLAATIDPRGAVAEIYSYDADYPRLGIKRGFNCLYMTAFDVRWEASMVPVANDTLCLHAPLPGTTSTPLSVVPSPAEDFTEADIPPVARWQRSPNGDYHIGIKCGARWCNVGPMPYVATGGPNGLGAGVFIPQSALPANPGAPKAERRVRRIMGWYDDQRLSWPVQNSDIPMPGAAHGVIVPVPNLESYTQSDFEGGYKPVGWIRLDAADARYKQKLNLEPGGVNRLELHKMPDSNVWLLAIIAPSGRRQIFPVKRRGHEDLVALYPGFTVPGAIRWRWHPNDETIWIPCLVGCCEVQSGTS